MWSVHNETPFLPVVMSRLRKFLSLTFGQKVLFGRAWCLLARYRIALETVSLARITQHLQHSPTLQSTEALGPDLQETAVEIGRIVAYAATATPWPSRCLVQVLVVQHLLAARDIPGQFFLGVNHAGAGATDSLAHAWLCCGDTIVSGEQGADQYAVVSSYAW